VSLVNQGLLPATLFTLMFAMGLRLDAGQFVALGSAWPRIVAAFVCMILGLPAIGLIVARLFALPPELALGLVLASASPVGTFSNLLAAFARANLALSVALTAASSLTAILTMPLLVNWALKSILLHGAPIQLPLLTTIGRVLFMVGVPIGIGIIARRRLGARADIWHHRIKNAAAIALVAIFLLIIASQRDAMRATVWMPVALFNLLALALGILVRQVFGADADAGTSFAIAHTIRQEETGLFIALTLLALPASALPLLVNSAFGLVSGSTLVWARRRSNAAATNRVSGASGSDVPPGKARE
jgi:bile acid:Na+ symporter, BASS family